MLVQDTIGNRINMPIEVNFRNDGLVRNALATLGTTQRASTGVGHSGERSLNREYEASQEMMVCSTSWGKECKSKGGERKGKGFRPRCGVLTQASEECIDSSQRRRYAGNKAVIGPESGTGKY
jgi:hypothetical protein